MRARRHTPEQVLRKLREAERLKADGLIIINDNLPGKTYATLTVAGLAPEQLLQAQHARPSGNTLHRIDDVTVGFTPGPSTAVVLPEGITINLPALLSLRLPERVRAGQELNAGCSNGLRATSLDRSRCEYQ